MALQPFVEPWSLLKFRNHFYTDGRTPWTGYQPAARPIPTHRTTQIQNKRTHKRPCLWVEFEHTIPAFKRAKRVHALDSVATVIDFITRLPYIISRLPRTMPPKLVDSRHRSCDCRCNWQSSAISKQHPMTNFFRVDDFDVIRDVWPNSLLSVQDWYMSPATDVHVFHDSQIEYLPRAFSLSSTCNDFPL
jgi:hypothetical protein